MTKRNLKVDVKCDECESQNTILLVTYEANVRRNSHYRCRKCRPQNHRSYWQDASVQQRHAAAIKTSVAYQQGIATRDLTGENNGMFGKRHTAETSAKMSRSRTGKLGVSATAWKGGKNSFTKRVKKLLSTRHRWFARVFERDGSKCRECGTTQQLDAHHIESVVKIIRRITQNHVFENEEQKLEWVIAQPEIADRELANGITLCRTHHRLAHKNWGSHVSP